MITYKPLWNTMKNKDITKYKLVYKYGIAQNTISRMSKNKPVSSVTIDELCKILNCNVQDIMAFIPDEETNIKLKSKKE